MPTLCWEAPCSSESAPPDPWAPALLSPQSWHWVHQGALGAAKELGWPLSPRPAGAERQAG